MSSSPQYGGGPSQYTEPQPPVQMPPSPPSQPGVPRASSSRMRSVLLALLAFIVIVAAASSFFVIHNNQVASQQAATATANANATTFARDTATANANATGTAIANATASAIANANATATAQATSHYPPFTTVALDDTLTTANSSSGWSQVSACQFTTAGYQISIAQAGFFEKCFASSTDFTDFAFQVTMTITKGDCGGLMFRAVDNQNFYVFNVCANAGYNAALFVKGANAGSTKFATSSAIHSGLNQPNILAVVVQGNTYNLYANGQNIDTFTDSTFTHGSVGVMALDLTSPTVVDYTNALVWTAS